MKFDTLDEDAILHECSNEQPLETLDDGSLEISNMHNSLGAIDPDDERSSNGYDCNECNNDRNYYDEDDQSDCDGFDDDGLGDDNFDESGQEVIFWFEINSDILNYDFQHGTRHHPALLDTFLRIMFNYDKADLSKSNKKNIAQPNECEQYRQKAQDVRRPQNTNNTQSNDRDAMIPQNAPNPDSVSIDSKNFALSWLNIDYDIHRSDLVKNTNYYYDHFESLMKNLIHDSKSGKLSHTSQIDEHWLLEKKRKEQGIGTNNNNKNKNREEKRDERDKSKEDKNQIEGGNMSKSSEDLMFWLDLDHDIRCNDIVHCTDYYPLFESYIRSLLNSKQKNASCQ